MRRVAREAIALAPCKCNGGAGARSETELVVEPPGAGLDAFVIADAQLIRLDAEGRTAEDVPDGRQQPNPQLADLVSLHVEVAADTPPGPCEIRLLGPAGLTNPLAFHVGRLPELREFEPNNPGAKPPLPPPAAATLPFTLNGQILPGDVDRFRFTARRSQPLVIRCHARDLIPYLADAVPGWFQMVVALRDAEGGEVAWADDFRFSPDPVLCFRIPRDGEYDLEIRDAIYRGREDFVYRVAIGEIPLRQGLALTGSVNQHGAVQPIGGVNEKIEGFFDVCADVGLDGAQGVIIPRVNVANLMLRSDVVEAVRAQRFHIHAVGSVDETIALLSALPAGARAADGSYPPGSVNARVQGALDRLSDIARSFAARSERA